MSYVKLSQYKEEIDALEVGQTTHVNHEDCEAGEDTRRRLYLTRTIADPTKVIAFCHNCQAAGVYVDSSYMTYRDNTFTHNWSGHLNTEVDVVETPTSVTFDGYEWPVYAKAWLYTNQLNYGHAMMYGIGYDANTDRVFLPRYRHMHVDKPNPPHLIGYQLRRVRPNSKEPKYLTVTDGTSRQDTWIWPKDRSDTAVVVEDYVSGIHIAEAFRDRLPAPTVVVNYGVKVEPTVMHKLAGTFKQVRIWLDNDSTHVKEQATLMARTIQLYGTPCTADLAHSDPKHYDAFTIQGILDDLGVNNG